MRIKSTAGRLRCRDSRDHIKIVMDGFDRAIQASPSGTCRMALDCPLEAGNDDEKAM
jgi:hypothetical protein